MSKKWSFFSKSEVFSSFEGFWGFSKLEKTPKMWKIGGPKMTKFRVWQNPQKGSWFPQGKIKFINFRCRKCTSCAQVQKGGQAPAVNCCFCTKLNVFEGMASSTRHLCAKKGLIVWHSVFKTSFLGPGAGCNFWQSCRGSWNLWVPVLACRPTKKSKSASKAGQR